MSTSYVKFSHAIPTAAVLFSGLAGAVDAMPNIRFEQPPAVLNSIETEELGNILTKYSVKDANFEEYKQIEVIHKFASNLLENIEDLDPEFSKLIYENYWDLI